MNYRVFEFVHRTHRAVLVGTNQPTQLDVKKALSAQIGV